VLEFHKAVGPLTDPARYGGKAADAFHLVIPALPGFAFSGQPRVSGWNIERTAAAWSTLMERLGYTDWVAQGGDWGAAVTLTLAHKRAPGLSGIHLNFVIYQPANEEVASASPDERRMLADAELYGNMFSGYARLQATRPQAVAYALSDSPIGQAAWIYSLFEDVSDTAGTPETVLSYDEMLDDIMLYWLGNASASSARLYWESATLMAGPPPFYPLATPTAISMFPKEQLRLSKRWAESRFQNLIHFRELPKGGHFAALEQPELFTNEIREGFRPLRGR
jgi:epoxide hydrolase